MKSIAEQGASDAKQLSAAQFADKKARLELTAAIERRWTSSSAPTSSCTD